MKLLNEPTARTLLEAYHAAWSRQDIDAMLALCSDDLTYFLNTGAPDGGPLRLFGKAEQRAFLNPIRQIAESVTVPVSFIYRDGVGRAQIEAFIKHRKSGMVLTGMFRQVLLFEGFKIAAIEEFHDAARMQAFWALVLSDDVKGATLSNGHEPVGVRLRYIDRAQPAFPGPPADGGDNA